MFTAKTKRALGLLLSNSCLPFSSSSPLPPVRTVLASHGTLKEAGAFTGPAFAQGHTVIQAELGNHFRTLLMALLGPLEIPQGSDEV